MTLLRIKDQTLPILAHQKSCTIQLDPNLPCHPIALILCSEKRLFTETVNIYWHYEMITVLYEMDTGPYGRNIFLT